MLDHIHAKSHHHLEGSMDGWGRTYDAIVNLMTLGQERKIRQATLELARIRPGDSILEVGCGTGSLTLAAKVQAGTQSQVFGIDTAADMLETARRKAARAGLDVQFQAGLIQDIPFPEGKFDLVLSSLMMHHVSGDDGKQTGIREMFRVLKPGGQLLIVDIEPPQNPYIKGPASLIFGREMFAHNVGEFIPLLENAGFIEIESRPTKYGLLSALTAKRP